MTDEEEARVQVPLVPQRMKVDGEGGFRLRGIECGQCGEKTFPGKPICPGCGSLQVSDSALGSLGKIWTYTVVYQGYGSMVLKPPYASAFVELDGGAFVHAPIVGCEPERVTIGMRVELKPLKAISEGNQDKMVYAFQPVSQAGSGEATDE